MRIIYVKNLTSGSKDWGTGRTFDANEEFQVPENLISLYSNNSNFLSILNIEAQVGNGDEYFSDLSEQIDWLKGNAPIPIIASEPIPTVQSDPNDRMLRPYKPGHVHIDASQQIFEITLSNKNENTYTYSCSVNPAFYDCIFTNHSQIRDGVYSVDTENHTLTTFGFDLPEGTHYLSKPVDIESYLDGDQPIHYMYGCFISAKDFGDDDVVRMQLVDKDGVGVALGWYTQEEFDYMGEYVFAEYDEGFVHQLSYICKLLTPKHEAEIPGGMYPRWKYYCKDPTKTDIKFWVDPIVEIFG